MDTKTKLQEAALALFTEQGVAATTISQIAGQAGIAEGSLYRHYVGKEDLARTLLTQISEQIYLDIESIAAETTDMESFISQLVFFMATLFDEHPNRFKYIFLSYTNRMLLIKKHPENILANRLSDYFYRFENRKHRSAGITAAQIFGAIQNTAAYCGEQEQPLADYCEALILASLRIIKD